MTTNDGTRSLVIHAPWNAPMARPTAIAAAIDGPRRPAVLHVEHRHDRGGEPAHGADRQVDLAEQQHEHDADRDRAHGRDLQHEVGEVDRRQEPVVQDLEDDPDGGDAEQHRQVAELALGQPAPERPGGSGQPGLLGDQPAVGGEHAVVVEVPDLGVRCPVPLRSCSTVMAGDPPVESSTSPACPSRRDANTCADLGHVGAGHGRHDLVGVRRRPRRSVATRRPRRSTMMRSATANTSTRLWLITTTPRPLVAEAPDEGEHLAGLRHAERRGRLVEDHQLRLAHRRLGHRDRLALAARERRHRRAHARDRHRQALQQPGGVALHVGLVEEPRCRPIRSRPRYRLATTSRLSHSARSWYTVAIPRAVASLGVVTVPLRAVELEAAAVGLEDARDQLDQGRLAGAVVADEGHHLAGRHLEVDLGQRLHGAEPLADVLQAEQHRRQASSSSTLGGAGRTCPSIGVRTRVS